MAAEQPAQAATRGVGLVHAALLTALILLVSLVAIVTRAPAPPTIAEFAPQAVKQIQRAPDEQSSQFGNGGNGQCIAGQPCKGGPTPGPLGPSATPPPTDSGRPTLPVKRQYACFGNPPRQTKDPQSPPCVPYWEGDNGGATWRGVTRDTITFAFPTTVGATPLDDALLAYFNRRYQFYGRQLVRKVLIPPGALFGNQNPSSMYADAVKVDQELQAFASTSYPTYSANGSPATYYDELARRGIISVTSEDDFRTEKDNFANKEFEGFQWAFGPSIDELGRNLAEWTCKSLVGKPPIHAGAPFNPAAPLNQQANRKFGVVVQRTFQKAVDTDVLMSRLGACDVHPTVVFADAEQQTDAAAMTAVVSKLSQAKVSSAICVCYQYLLNGILTQAQQQNYFPEWLLTGQQSVTADGNAAASGAYAKNGAVSHVLGLNGQNKYMPIPDQPWFWAVRDTDPHATPSQYSSGSLSGTNQYQLNYQAMLLLASGIQLAGPILTPQRFKQGLMEAQFPNPKAGQAPYYQATVGFDETSHTMVEDYGLIWFSRTSTSPDTGNPGTRCYLNRGQRWGLDRWDPTPPEGFYPGSDPPPPKTCA
jgi:hypothetical protein